MPDAGITKRDQILTDALGVFGRYGYRRTSMELIAQAAGISRPALYQHFKGKEHVFRAMGARLLDDVIAAAETAQRADGTVADRLYGVLSVKLELFVGTVEAEFRSEMLAEAGVVADDLMQSFERRHIAIIEALLTFAAAELDLLDVGAARPRRRHLAARCPHRHRAREGNAGDSVWSPPSTGRPDHP